MTSTMYRNGAKCFNGRKTIPINRDSSPVCSKVFQWERGTAYQQGHGPRVIYMRDISYCPACSIHYRRPPYSPEGLPYGPRGLPYSPYSIPSFRQSIPNGTLCTQQTYTCYRKDSASQQGKNQHTANSEE